MENKSLSFVKRVDQQLLRNNPVTWSTRIFPAIISGLCFALLLALICFIVPNDPRNRSAIPYWITLISIVSLLAFVFWMIYLLRFNVFKRFGKWSNVDTLKTFLSYFIITLIIVSWPYIPPVVESVRADSAYSGEELVKDINEMNSKLCLLERDSINRRFESDTLEISSHVVGLEQKQILTGAATPSAPSLAIDSAETDYVVYDREDYYFVDTATLRSKLAIADSVNQISDSVYVVYDCPDFRFIYGWGITGPVENKLLTSMELYRRYLQYRQPADKEQLKADLGKLFTKYSRLHDPLTLSADIDKYGYYSETGFMYKIRDRYDLSIINSNLENITEKKYRWDKGTIRIGVRIAYYITLVLALLVLIYRHTTRKTFFLSLLTSAVLFILTSLFIALAPYESDAFFIWPIIYFIIFLALAAFIFNSRYRSAVTGIGLNLLVFMTAFMPLLITGYYYSTLRKKYYRESEWRLHEDYFRNEEYHYFLSEVGGFLLLILLLATVYRLAFKKWFSLPEQ